MPPLNALKAFEATARHLSFSKAAAELHVTPAALSHQIRGLEDLLGLKLFFRRARAIELTDAARLIYPGIQTGFESLRQAVERLEPNRQDRVLVVSATPGLTAKWLAPKLYRFLAKHPDIDTRISASSAYVNFVADGVDVGIRLSSGNHPDLYVERLSEEWLLPLCSPKLLDGAHPLRSPKDLVHFTLIQVDLPGVVPTWSDWFQMAGVDNIDSTRGLRSMLPITPSTPPAKAPAWSSPTNWSPRVTSALAVSSSRSGPRSRSPDDRIFSSARRVTRSGPPSKAFETGYSPRSKRRRPSCGRRARASPALEGARRCPRPASLEHSAPPARRP